jgi:glyoxylate reductase
LHLPNVVATRRLPGGALDRLEGVASLRLWSESGPAPPEFVLENLPDALGLVCIWTDRVDVAVLERAPKLVVISQMAVGVDNIDLSAATDRGIPVGNTPGVLVETTADLTWALILGVGRRITESERYLRSGLWRPETWSLDLLTGRDVFGKRLGIVGMGRIGTAVARRAAGFDMEVVYSSRSPKDVPGARPVSLEDLLEGSDFVSIHCALTPETRGLIGGEQLALMKPDAYLINTARGGIVDERALIESLREGRIAGAALDVYENEPLDPNSPLLDFDNVVLVPHIGSASVETRSRMAHLAVDNLLAGLNGERLPHCANPVVYEREPFTRGVRP